MPGPLRIVFPLIILGAAFDGSALVFFLELAIALRTLSSLASDHASVQAELARL